MTDFHTHVLPGIDDGSHNIEMTRELLFAEKGQGVDRVVATPHFYAHRDSFDRFLARRGKAIAEVQQVLGDDPHILTGAEVYFFPGMGKADRLPELCITDGERRTDVILVEMPFQQWKEEVLQDLRDIIRKQNLRVVLAHVERYVEFQKDSSVWNAVMALPVTVQINAGSFLKGWRRRRLCLKLLEEHERAVIGSDCHNLTSRVPNVGEARAVIEKKFGTGRLSQMDQVMEELLG